MAQLIRQYLAGELDDKAMHDLERRALDDPFLADALEGYALHAPDQQAQQEELSQRLAARIAPQQTRVRPLYTRWAAAAAILLLLFTGGWFLYHEQQHIAPIAQRTTQDSFVKEIPQASAVMDSVPQPAAIAITSSDQPPVTAKSRPVPVPAPAASEPSPAFTSADAPVARAMAPMAAPVPPLKQAAPATDMTADRVQPTQELATVTADQPAMAEKKAVLKKGEYPVQEVSPPSVLASKANVQRNAQRYGVAGSMYNDSLYKDILPAPVGGFPAFERYLQEHTINPENHFEGTVRVSFTVMPDSTLQQFKVLKSIHPACDAAAIRVIKEGPKWQPAAGGKAATVEVVVPFRKKGE
ncbi:energy transducer TonB [Chitinophaga nivalis]|uniref:Energy transducer TonB n=1 Tax=Chitinophaga nivalis TaxID=2991709 RepID=A0ABT3IVT0_9BACT|nr:energy transducer TonB [Chitinophaga nivalis]MCW3462220.1 energy transducer TonB [Chitinophaga nivalis]MCW3488088.1 energy transducer TonB [Chitinophaga nivalis]